MRSSSNIGRPPRCGAERLFRSERDQGVDPSGPAGRDQRRHEGDDRHQQQKRREGVRVHGVDLEQDVSDRVLSNKNDVLFLRRIENVK